MLGMGRRLTSVWNRAPGRKTSRPGRGQRRQPRRLSPPAAADCFSPPITCPTPSSWKTRDPALFHTALLYPHAARRYGPPTAAVFAAGATAFGGRSFQWKFLLADVRFVILGVDFFRNFELVVNVGKEQLLLRAALVSPVSGDVYAVAGQAVTPAACSSEWTKLLAEFISVSQPFTVRSSPAHGVEHSIETVDHWRQRNFAV
jgi:hypothetical protein